jgi:uncharacterized membrane protein
MDSSQENTSIQQEITPDRLTAFSDGVFAFAITLLVLNLHVPLPQELSVKKSLFDALKEQWPTYLSFILSFMIVGIVWGNHHTMFSYIKRSNHTLVVLNLLLLLSIVSLPSVAALLALYIGTPEQRTAVLVYSGVWAIGGIFYNLLWWYASWNHRLLDRNLPQRTVHRLTWRYVFGPLLYVLAFGLAFFWNGILGLGLCILLAIMYLLPTVADRVRSSG